MKGLLFLVSFFLTLLTTMVYAKEPPTQVVYRFDDHRYLELKGWDCEGELWYTDTKKISIQNLSASFIGFSPVNLCILRKNILLLRVGEPEDLSFQKTTDRHGTALDFRQPIMSQTVMTMRHTMM